MSPLLDVMFFVSGAAGLVYEVAWVRSIGLIFGASHLAVTTVLAVYMGGLALGAVLLGRRVSAVVMRIGEARAVVMFVDNDRCEVYGERFPSEGDAVGRLKRRVQAVVAAPAL